MGKIKVPRIDIDEVNQISITKVASDWGIDLYPGGKDMLAYCPNPNHTDTNLGSCYFIENGEKNFFYCFSCGAGGGPIDLVMLVDRCSFKEALEKLAHRYGLINYKEVDKNSLPPKWEGLSNEEYKNFFKLKNAIIKIPKGVDEKGEVIYAVEKYTLRDLAQNDPEAHDELLISKFSAVILGLANFYALLEEGNLPGIKFTEEWENAIMEVVNKYKELLEKGLCNKQKIDELFPDREKELEKKLKEELRRAIEKSLNKSA